MSKTEADCSFCFLSENYLIIPCIPRAEYRAYGEKRDRSRPLGRLLLYRLPSDSHEANPSCHCVAEFTLPHYGPEIAGLPIHAHTAPTTTTAVLDQQTQVKPLPKIFETTPGNHLIHVPIVTGTGSSSESAALIVPAQALLDTLAEVGDVEWTRSSRNMPIPWKKWGHFTSRMYTGDGAVASSFFCERRLVAFQPVENYPRAPSPADSLNGLLDSPTWRASPTDTLKFDNDLDNPPTIRPNRYTNIDRPINQPIHIWDFDQNRLRARRAKEHEEAEEIDPNRSKSARRAIEQSSLGLPPRARSAREYTVTGMKMEWGIIGGPAAVMISDEHGKSHSLGYSIFATKRAPCLDFVQW